MRRRIAVLIAVSLVTGAGVLSPARAAGPVNDDFAAAKVIESLPYSDAVSTADATTQLEEPGAADVCAAAGASVWYRYTSPVNDRVDFSTDGSSFAAYIGIYTGSALSDLTLHSCSRAPYLYATAGTTYYIQIGDTDVSPSGEFVPVAGDLKLSVASLGQCEKCPTFRNYETPAGMRFRAGETSIGVNPKTNAALFLLLTHTLHVTWDDAANATWKDVSALTTSLGTADPILWTDRTTGRTFVAQLYTTLAVGGSIVAYTDDDGESWTTTEPAQVNPAWDHESIGGGPYPPPLNAVPHIYPNAVYYCAQLGASLCSRSDDGGLTWGPQTVMSPQITSCGGLHGHPQVNPLTGVMVVPNRDCGQSSGMMASTDGAVTFERRLVPGTKPCNCDPSVAYDDAGTMYFVTSSGGHPVVATSTDDGKTWTKPYDVGRALGLENAQQPMAVAGSAGRAAVAYYGTTTYGDDQSGTFQGVWHMYVSMTYDGGKHWETIDATPDDPVQRGCIWMGGGGNPCRNLLDFQGMTMDAKGRVLVGYADGCQNACLQADWTPEIEPRSSVGVIARQTTGKGLLAAFDDELDP